MSIPIKIKVEKHDRLLNIYISKEGKKTNKLFHIC